MENHTRKLTLTEKLSLNLIGFLTLSAVREERHTTEVAEYLAIRSLGYLEGVIQEATGVVPNSKEKIEKNVKIISIVMANIHFLECGEDFARIIKRDYVGEREIEAKHIHFIRMIIGRINENIRFETEHHNGAIKKSG